MVPVRRLSNGRAAVLLMPEMYLCDALVAVHIAGAAKPYFGGFFAPHVREPVQWAGRLNVREAGLSRWMSPWDQYSQVDDVTEVRDICFDTTYLTGGLGPFASLGKLLPYDSFVAGTAATPLLCPGPSVLTHHSAPFLVISSTIAYIEGVRSDVPPRLRLAIDVAAVHHPRVRQVLVPFPDPPSRPARAAF